MSANGNGEAGLRRKCQRRGIAIGMGIFLPFGAVLSIATGNHALTGAGVALALTLGVAFGELIYRREKSKENSE